MKMYVHIFSVAAFLWTAFLPSLIQAESAREINSLKVKIDALIPVDQIDGTAILAVDLHSGKALYDLNADLPLKPASVMKLITSHSAITRLGSDFTWKTKVTIGGINAGRARFISIRGSGDPSLTSETLWQLARQIYKSGVRQVDSIILADAAYIDHRPRSGARAYESGASALELNYNSVAFEICPTTPGHPARTITDPWEIETSLSGKVMTVKSQGDPVAVEDRSSCDKTSCRLAFELGGTVASDSPCILTYRSVENPAEYFGRVLIKFMKSLGITGAYKLHFNSMISEDSSAISFEHSSQPLSQILNGLNNFSVNVTADQLVYAIGSNDNGELSFRDGLERIASDLNRLGIESGAHQVLDGSGLSHDNRLTASAIIKVLSHQYDNAEQGIEYLASLSRWGHTGTLQKRGKLPFGVTVRGKTGSLDGVSAIAGYLFRPERAPIAFAIMENRVASKAKAVDIEDKIIEYLALSQ